MQHFVTAEFILKKIIIRDHSVPANVDMNILLQLSLHADTRVVHLCHEVGACPHFKKSCYARVSYCYAPWQSGSMGVVYDYEL